jgi:hypothetical protein
VRNWFQNIAAFKCSWHRYGEGFFDCDAMKLAMNMISRRFQSSGGALHVGMKLTHNP